MDTGAFLVTVERHGPWTVVRPRGEIDLLTCDQFRACLTSAADGGSARMVVDLSGVSFLDSTGLSAIVACHRETRAGGGTLALIINQSSIRRLFTITGLDRAIPIHATLEAALTL